MSRYVRLNPTAMHFHSEEELPSTFAERRAARLGIAVFWFAVAVLTTIALFFNHRNTSLDGDYQGWASASCMVMARSFAQLGFLHTHFVPFQNNLPMGADPDVYLHWPPLYPMVLSVFLRIFGDKASSGRLLELLISLAASGLVFLIARRLYTPRVAVLAGFFFLTVRATYEGASAILQQPLAVLFALCSVYCFLRATPGESQESRVSSHVFAALGALATALTILSAWDPVFVPFGVLAAALFLRQRRQARLAAVYCVTAVLTFVAVEVDYILAYPKLFANQLATIAYRAGLPFRGTNGVRLATLVDVMHYDQQYGFIAAYWRILRVVNDVFPSLVLVACLTFIALWWRSGKRSDQSGTWVLGALLLPTVVWFALMRNYVAHHSFPQVLAAPFVAIASGFVLDRLWTRYSQTVSDRPILWVLAIGLPMLVILPLIIQFRDGKVQPPPAFKEFSELVQRETPAEAIVITPVESLLPTYYSQRHLIRGVESDEWLAWSIEEARREFPGAPLFLAVRNQDARYFMHGLVGLPESGRNGESVLYRIP